MQAQVASHPSLHLAVSVKGDGAARRQRQATGAPPPPPQAPHLCNVLQEAAVGAEASAAEAPQQV